MGGAIFKDEAEVRDAVTASLETEVKDAVVPCPKCTAETKPYGEAPRASEDKRICSSCRTVSSTIKESALGGGTPRFPCEAMVKVTNRATGKTAVQKCGRETKVKASGITGPAPSRKCSHSDCGHIFDLA